MNLNIPIEELNDLLSEDKKYLVEIIYGHTGIPDKEWDGVQGEYNESYKIYKSPNMPENLYLKVTYRTDSYGDNNHVDSYKFVSKLEKAINTYE